MTNLTNAQIIELRTNAVKAATQGEGFDGEAANKVVQEKGFANYFVLNRIYRAVKFAELPEARQTELREKTAARKEKKAEKADLNKFRAKKAAATRKANKKATDKRKIAQTDAELLTAALTVITELMKKQA